MKAFLLSFLLLLTIATNAQINVPSYVPTNGLVGWWPFNGNANDESGNGNNGTVNGATLTTDRFGLPNVAYSFISANNNYISINNNPVQNGTATISGWFNPSTPIGGPIFHIGSDNSTAANCNGYFLSFGNLANPNGTNLLIDVSCQGNYNTGWNATANNWYHFILIRNQNNLTAYINGIVVGTFTPSSINPPSNNIFFGSTFFSNSVFFNGKIDDIGIWNRALTQQEITNLYNAQNPCANIVSNFFTQDTLAVCGTSTTLSAPANYSYAWSNGATTQTIPATQTGWYKCTVTNTSGCSTTDSVFVSLVNANIQQNDTTICAGSSVQLSVASSVISNGNNLFALQWSNNYLNTNGIFRKAILDNDSLVISGSIWSSWPSGTTDQLITKISSAGNLAFQQVRAPGWDHDGYASVQKMNNGNYIFFGQENAQGTQYFDGFWTIFNRSGIEINYGFFSVPGSSSGSDMLKLPNGNYVFTGPQGNDGYIALTDSNLSQINYQNFPVGNWTGPMLAIDSVNNFIYVLTSTANLIKVCKYDFNLNQILSNTLSFAGNVGIADMQFYSGKLYVVGYFESSGLRHSLFGTIDAMCNLSYSQVASDESEYRAIVSVPAGFVVACSMLSGTQAYANRLYYVDNNGLKMDSIMVSNSPFVSGDLVYGNGKLFNVGASGTGYSVGIPRVDMLLFQSSHTSYLWSIGDTTSTINVSPTQTTTYYCTISNGISSCTDSVTIYVNNPTVNAGNNQSVCAGNPVTLTAATNGQGTLSWSNSVVNGQAFVPVATTNYVATVSDALGCTKKDTVTITVNSNPTATLTANNTAICPNGSTTLTASGGATYLWSNGDTSSTTTVNQAGNYYVIATNEYGCADTSNMVSITQKAMPTTVKIKYNGASTVCEPATVNYQLDMPLGSTSGFAYQWYNSGAPITGATDSAYSANISGNYSVAISGGNTCVKISSGKVATVNTKPIATCIANGPTTLCSGGAVTISAPVIQGYSYTWLKDGVSAGSGTTKVFKLAGNYTVVAKLNGCMDTASPVINVIVNPLPIASISAQTNLTFCVGDSCTLLATPLNMNSYRWYSGNNLLATTSVPTQKIGVSGTIKVMVVDNNNCTSKLSATNVKTKITPIPIATITVSGSSLLSTTGFVKLKASPTTADAYQWYKDGQLLQGATNSIYITSVGGTFNAQVTKTGCTGESNAITIAAATPKEAIATYSTEQFEIIAYPNPVEGILTITIQGVEQVAATIQVMDFSGRLVATKEMTTSSTTVDMSGYASGVYLIRYKDAEGRTGTIKITKE